MSLRVEDLLRRRTTVGEREYGEWMNEYYLTLLYTEGLNRVLFESRYPLFLSSFANW